LRLPPAHFGAASVLLFLASSCMGLAQHLECPPSNTLLSANDSVYSDATDLARILRNQGFIIRCIFPTKLGSIFQIIEGNVTRSTIEGEANFRTNYGDVDVVFVPKPQSFAAFKITQHHLNKGYLYTFAGAPRVWSVNRFETNRRTYFLKHDNALLLVSDDKLRIRLEQALQLPTRTR
jgi:hypothetical protein